MSSPKKIFIKKKIPRVCNEYNKHICYNYENKLIHEELGVMFRKYKRRTMLFRQSFSKCGDNLRNDKEIRKSNNIFLNFNKKKDFMLY